MFQWVWDIIKRQGIKLLSSSYPHCLNIFLIDYLFNHHMIIRNMLMQMYETRKKIIQF